MKQKSPNGTGRTGYPTPKYQYLCHFLKSESEKIQGFLMHVSVSYRKTTLFLRQPQNSAIFCTGKSFWCRAEESSRKIQVHQISQEHSYVFWMRVMGFHYTKIDVSLNPFYGKKNKSPQVYCQSEQETTIHCFLNVLFCLSDLMTVDWTLPSNFAWLFIFICSPEESSNILNLI